VYNPDKSKQVYCPSCKAYYNYECLTLQDSAPEDGALHRIIRGLGWVDKDDPDFEVNEWLNVGNYPYEKNRTLTDFETRLIFLTRHLEEVARVVGECEDSEHTQIPTFLLCNMCNTLI
jgi:hypothetical protein